MRSATRRFERVQKVTVRDQGEGVALGRAAGCARTRHNDAGPRFFRTWRQPSRATSGVGSSDAGGVTWTARLPGMPEGGPSDPAGRSAGQVAGQVIDAVGPARAVRAAPGRLMTRAGGAQPGSERWFVAVASGPAGPRLVGGQRRMVGGAAPRAEPAAQMVEEVERPQGQVLEEDAVGGARRAGGGHVGGPVGGDVPREVAAAVAAAAGVLRAADRVLGAPGQGQGLDAGGVEEFEVPVPPRPLRGLVGVVVGVGGFGEQLRTSPCAEGWASPGGRPCPARGGRTVERRGPSGARRQGDAAARGGHGTAPAAARAGRGRGEAGCWSMFSRASIMAVVFEPVPP